MGGGASTGTAETVIDGISLVPSTAGITHTVIFSRFCLLVLPFSLCFVLSQVKVYRSRLEEVAVVADEVRSERRTKKVEILHQALIHSVIRDAASASSASGDPSVPSTVDEPQREGTRRASRSSASALAPAPGSAGAASYHSTGFKPANRRRTGNTVSSGGSSGGSGQHSSTACVTT